MHDKVETETVVTNEAAPTFIHTYFETGADILSKPRALVDLMESMSVPTAVIFCNAPSEADLVAAMLRKNGINCQKLIGHVPSSKVEQTNEEIKAGTLKVVVTTDIGATELNMNAFEYIVNYSIHEDPETYFNRCADLKPGAQIKSVLSLVSPLDIGNFHYLRKLAEFEFVLGTLPTKADLIKNKINNLFVTAANSAHLAEEGMSDLVELVMANENKNAVIALLLHNTFVSLPEAIAQARPKGQPDRERSEHGDRGGDRRHDNRNRRDRDGGSEGGEGGFQRRQHDENVKAEVRYYLGIGTTTASVDQVKALLAEKGVDAAGIKRVFLRDSYGFVDSTTEAADQVLAALKDSEIAGTKLYSVKATELPGSRPERSHSDGDNSDRREYRGGGRGGDRGGDRHRGGRGGDRRRPHHNDRRERSHSSNENMDSNGGEEDFSDDDTSQVKMLANYKGELGKDRD